MNEALQHELAAVGTDLSSIRWLDQPSAEAIEYLDIVQRRARAEGLVPSCVIEHEEQPLLYVADAGSLAVAPETQDASVLRLLKTLAVRGEPGFLAVSRPGQLIIYPLSLEPRLPQAATIDTTSGRYASLIPDLAAGVPPEPLRPKTADQRRARALRTAVHDLLFKVLTEVAGELSARSSLRNHPDDVLSLVGRTLFARFLIDREILRVDSIRGIEGGPVNCFSSASNAVATCLWLDDRFNGELLPLRDGDYERFFKELGGEAESVCRGLSNIMLRAPGGQPDFELYWNDVNFAHVPVGLLSEVYEDFAHNIDAHLASTESIHYTPRRIAQLLVEESLAGLTTCKLHEAVCLDPAAGGGVFLVLLLRRLVAARWRALGRRPSRLEIHDILYRQIRGFDINISALKMAALSLYLTAIELDPDTANTEGARFEPLVGRAGEGRVLTHVRHDDEPHPNPFVLGSLGNVVPDSHRGRYDIVVGNPPWTAPDIDKKKPKAVRMADQNRLKTLQTEYTRIVRRIAQDRSPETLSEVASTYTNPDGVPDLPFIWRAMEWAKPRGVIAYAIHARLLFKRTQVGKAARDALFKALRVTGIVNGAALRQTDVWPNVDAPWSLLFAVNEQPMDSQVFYFVSPVLETALNGQSKMRLDYGSSEPIQFGVLRQDATLLKTLFRGTALDADIIRRLEKIQTIPLHEYWTRHGLASGDGYQLGPGRDASDLRGMPELRAGSGMRFVVDIDALPRFNRSTLRRIKKEGFFRSPFVLFPESPSERDEGRVLLALRDLVFSESYYGYSTTPAESDGKKRSNGGPKAGKPIATPAEDVARYLYVIGYSSLFQYVMLMTSSKFGVERDSILKEDVDDFPLVPFEHLTAEHVRRVRSISAMIAGGGMPWREVDAFVADLYGLKPCDLEAISDTLAMSLPFDAQKQNAESAPGAETVEAFRARLESELHAFVSLVDGGVHVTAVPPISEGWRFLRIDATSGSSWEASLIPSWVSYLADHQGASRVILQSGPGALVLGLLAQGRYWTLSRARLCALDVVREFGGALTHGIAHAA